MIAYGSEDEAIRIANGSRYGLHAAVIGTDVSRARRVASQLRAGRVVINSMTDDPWPLGRIQVFGRRPRDTAGMEIEAFLEIGAHSCVTAMRVTERIGRRSQAQQANTLPSRPMKPRISSRLGTGRERLRTLQTGAMRKVRCLSSPKTHTSSST